MTAQAPAKVNLGLAVTGVRADGYHELRSVFLRLDLSDELRVRRTPGTADTLEAAGEPGIPVGGNLVLRAAARLRDRLSAMGSGPLPALAFRLDKRIPMGAGLAGGSSDAAAAIDLALAAWGVAWTPEERLALAARLGADVPFFVGGWPAAAVSGIGDLVVPLPGLDTPAGLLLVTPPARLSTPDVFAAWDAQGGPSRGVAAVEALTRAWSGGLDGPTLAGMAGSLRDANDLWPAALALAPSLHPLRDALESTLGLPILLTGSGSTLVALYPSPSAAGIAAEGLAGRRQPSLTGCRVIVTRDERAPQHQGDRP